MGLEGTASVCDGVSMFDWWDLLICKITVLHLIRHGFMKQEQIMMSCTIVRILEQKLFLCVLHESAEIWDVFILILFLLGCHVNLFWLIR